MDERKNLDEKYVRVEGAALLIYGGLSILMSLILIFIMRSEAENSIKNVKVALMAGFAILFLTGIYAAVIGIFYIFHKIYFDFANTSSITKNDRYNVNDILQILKNNKKLMDISEKGSLSSILEAMYPPFLKMPDYIKRVAAVTLERFIITSGIILILFFGGVSTYMLKDESSKFFSMNYLGWTAFIVASYYWIRRKSWKLSSKLLSSKKTSKVIMSAVTAAIFFPVIVMFLKSNFKLNEIEQKPYIFLILFFIMTAYYIAAVIYMIKVRSSSLESAVQVSRKSGNIQENINPNTIFFGIQKLITDKIYYKKYIETAPKLDMHGSQNKGNFESYSLCEIMEDSFSKDYKSKYIKLIAVNTGIALLGSVVLFLLLIGAVKSGEINFINIFLIPMTILFFTNSLIGIMHNFLIETYMESSILFTEIKGTYSESNKVFGNAINDSLKESNSVVRSNINYHFYSSKVVTSSFGISGERTILSIDENQQLLNEAESTMFDVIKNNRNIGEIGEDEIKVFKERQELNSIAVAMKKGNNAEYGFIEVKEEKKRAVENVSEIYCSACNTVHNLKNKFCPNCGARMESAD